MKLVKYVPVTASGNWFNMHNTMRAAIAELQSFELLVRVEEWVYDELPNGCHDTPSKRIVREKKGGAS